MPDDPALLLIAHGTRNPDGAAEMAVLVQRIHEVLGVTVGHAWLEDFTPPDAVTAANLLTASGARSLVTLPLLVLGAGHAKTDVPRCIAQIHAAQPNLELRHARVLGLQPVLFDLARARLDAVSNPADRARDALVVTGAGSSDPDANGDLAKAARFLAETSGFRRVEIAFAGVSWPTADVAFARLAADDDVRRIVRFSWSLLAGLLEQRIDGWATAVALSGSTPILDAGRFGPDPLVATAVAQRYREALAGDVRMNCDLCAYRLPLPGFERRSGAPSAGGTGEKVNRPRPTP